MALKNSKLLVETAFPTPTLPHLFFACFDVVNDLKMDLGLILKVSLKEQPYFHWMGVLQGGPLLLSLCSTYSMYVCMCLLEVKY